MLEIYKDLSNYPRHPSMRGEMGFELYKTLRDKPEVFLLTGDLGYKLLDPHIDNFPSRAFSVGASELSMMGMAAGLAQEGKKVFTYTISSFYMRAAEPIALYIAREQLPVVMLGSGRDRDYAHDGPSHDAITTQEYMAMLGIKSYYPETKEEIGDLMQGLLKLNEPAFVSLNR